MAAAQQKTVQSVAHLRRLIRAGRHDFSILLAGGLLRSRKTIHETKDGRFRIANHIDGTIQTLTDGELHMCSNIGEAIAKGCLIAE